MVEPGPEAAGGAPAVPAARAPGPHQVARPPHAAHAASEAPHRLPSAAFAFGRQVPQKSPPRPSAARQQYGVSSPGAGRGVGPGLGDGLGADVSAGLGEGVGAGLALVPLAAPSAAVLPHQVAPPPQDSQLSWELPHGVSPAALAEVKQVPQTSPRLRLARQQKLASSCGGGMAS